MHTIHNVDCIAMESFLRSWLTSCCARLMCDMGEKRSSKADDKISNSNCLAQVSFAYTPERMVFRKMSISADLESRIALVYIFHHELVEMFNCFISMECSHTGLSPSNKVLLLVKEPNPQIW